MIIEVCLIKIFIDKAKDTMGDVNEKASDTFENISIVVGYGFSSIMRVESLININKI